MPFRPVLSRSSWLALLVVIVLAVGIGGVGSAARAGIQAHATPSPTVEGLIVVSSVHSVAETIDLLEATLTEQGLIVVARIDHAANAESAGKSLRPTQLLIFGNPALGTELMLANQTIGIDLPQKFLAWENETGQVFLAYNDPAYLAVRHGLDGQQETLDRIAKALAMFAERVTAQ